MNQQPQPRRTLICKGKARNREICKKKTSKVGANKHFSLQQTEEDVIILKSKRAKYLPNNEPFENKSGYFSVG